jgi:hypothetical protein
MADKDVQMVKQTGTLWTVSAVLGIMRDVLLIIALLGAIATLIMTIPMINSAREMMSGLGTGGFSQGGGSIYYNNTGGQGYGGQNMTGQQGGGNQSGNDEARQQANSLALRVKGEVDSGNWDGAIADWGTLKPMLMSLGMSQEMQADLTALEQALYDQDQATFDTLFDQMQGKYGAPNASGG